MKKYQLITLSLLACGFMSSLQAANLISNGSFEQTTIPTQTTAQQPGWKSVAGYGESVTFGTASFWNDITASPFTASQGTQIAILNGADYSAGLLSDRVSLTAGQSYTLSYNTRLLSAWNVDWSAIAPNSTMGLAVALQSNDGFNPLYTFYFDPHVVVNNPSSWNTQTFTFTPTFSSDYVKLSIYANSGDNSSSHVYTAIDNIQLNAIPEPSTYSLLMLVGAFGMISSSRRRRSIV
jgi:hypothetical protein